MFTGIVQEIGTIDGVEHATDGTSLRVVLPTIAARLRLGDSVALDGACLTATTITGDVVTFEAMGETLRRTTIGALGTGDRVNAEGAVLAGEPLGGHIVQGHIDAVGEIVEARTDGIALVLRVLAPADLHRYLVEKGSVAVAGVSLTVSALVDDGFEVWLIPHTREATTLGRLAVGDRVNLEADLFAKYVERLVAIPR